MSRTDCPSIQTLLQYSDESRGTVWTAVPLRGAETEGLAWEAKRSDRPADFVAFQVLNPQAISQKVDE